MISIGVQLATGGAEIGGVLDAAQAYEEAGAESVWIGDHLIDYYDPSRPVPECFVTCALVLCCTRRVVVGTLVANALGRHPGVIAKMAATLDSRFPGRLELVLGTAGTRAEYEALGVPFPRRGARVERLAHAVRVLQRLREPGPVTDAALGLHEAHCQPPLARVRIGVGALAPRTARTAGKFADEVNVIDYHQVDVPEVLELARTAAATAGRRITSSIMVPSPSEQAIGGGPHPDAGLDRARALGADRVIFRLLPPYPPPEEVFAE